MATFLMFGKYSSEATKTISPRRTEEAIALVKKFGGEVKATYALLGDVDLVSIVELPDTERAMQVGVGLTKLLGISFSTRPAVTVERFDKLIAG